MRRTSRSTARRSGLLVSTSAASSASTPRQSSSSSTAERWRSAERSAAGASATAWKTSLICCHRSGVTATGLRYQQQSRPALEPTRVRFHGGSGVCFPLKRAWKRGHAYPLSPTSWWFERVHFASRGGELIHGDQAEDRGSAEGLGRRGHRVPRARDARSCVQWRRQLGGAARTTAGAMGKWAPMRAAASTGRSCRPTPRRRAWIRPRRTLRSPTSPRPIRRSAMSQRRTRPPTTP
jgi:hypothetical protein